MGWISQLKYVLKHRIAEKIITPETRVDPTLFPEEEFPVYCPKCEYLLIGIPENRCPECGRPYDRGRLLIEQYVLNRNEAQCSKFHRILKRLSNYGVIFFCVGWLLLLFMDTVSNLAISPIISAICFMICMTWCLTLLSIGLISLHLDSRLNKRYRLKRKQIVEAIAPDDPAHLVTKKYLWIFWPVILTPPVTLIVFETYDHFFMKNHYSKQHEGAAALIILGMSILMMIVVLILCLIVNRFRFQASQKIPSELKRRTILRKRLKWMIGAVGIVIILMFSYYMSPFGKSVSVSAHRSLSATISVSASTGDLTIDLGNGVKMELVLIPAGEFMMGSENGSSDEKPIHLVRIRKPFYLGKYEVTQSQWQAMMGDNPSIFKGERDLPVENVFWNDCQSFCRKLSHKVGREIGLPTEAQWEYACRAGSTTKYCFGDSENTLGDYAWYSGNSGNKTHPVGTKKPNARGLYDMHGNVWEWCVDEWYNYNIAPTDGYSSGQSGFYSYRPLRGGSWRNNAGLCRSAFRLWHWPDDHLNHFGFRVSSGTP